MQEALTPETASGGRQFEDRATTGVTPIMSSSFTGGAVEISCAIEYHAGGIICIAPNVAESVEDRLHPLSVGAWLQLKNRATHARRTTARSATPRRGRPVEIAGLVEHQLRVRRAAAVASTCELMQYRFRP